MSEQATTELTLTLPAETVQRLQEEAERQHLPLPDLAREAIETYLDELDEDEDLEDTPDEEILADLRQGFLDIAAGNFRPADEVLAELRARREQRPK